MKRPSQESRSTVDLAVPKSATARSMKENQRKALELGNLAEHASGTEREELHRKARRKAG